MGSPIPSLWAPTNRLCDKGRKEAQESYLGHLRKTTRVCHLKGTEQGELRSPCLTPQQTELFKHLLPIPCCPEDPSLWLSMAWGLGEDISPSGRL